MKYLKNIQIRSTNDDDDDDDMNDDEENEDDYRDGYDRVQTAKGLSHNKITELLKIEREKLQGKYFKYAS